MSGTWDAELRFAHELADAADAITLPAFRARPEVLIKDDGSPVTVADRDAERAMRAAIERRFARDAILGEEDGLSGDGNGGRVWILDPIDGTKNFVRGVPVYATLVCLAIDERGAVAVISAPALGTRWEAVVGQGARQDGRTIRVSAVERLEDAQVSFGGLGLFVGDEDGGADARVVRATARQRGFGDFWQHCLVASGGVDAAMEAEVNRWDLAAVKVLVDEAGGRFTSLRGEDTDDGGSALSSNGRVHDALLALVGRGTGGGG